MGLLILASFLNVLVTIQTITLDPSFWAAQAARGDALAAIDGDEWTPYTTRWPAATSDYIWVDMLTTQTFDNLNISFKKRCESENIIFVASYSSDNVTWVPFWTQSQQNLTQATYTAPEELHSRYLRFQVTRGAAWCEWSINDIRVNLGAADVINPCVAPRIKTRKQAIYNALQSYGNSLHHITSSSQATYSWPAEVNNSLRIGSHFLVNVVTTLETINGDKKLSYKHGLGQDWFVQGALALKDYLVALSNVIVDKLGSAGWSESASDLGSNYGVGMAFEFLEKHPELNYQLQGNERARFFQALKTTLHDPNDWMWWAAENSFVDQQAFGVAYLIATTLQYEIKKNPYNTYLTLDEVNQWLKASALFGIQVTQGPVPGSHSYKGCCGLTSFSMDNKTTPTIWRIHNATPNQGGTGPRIQSDSATYGGGSLGEGVGPYLFVHHKYPNPFSPEYNNATLWRLIGDWAEGYANLHMPYGDQRAVMFNYGDASFFQGTGYFGDFFEVMATIMKDYNLPQARRLKKVANMFWMFHTGGKSVPSSFFTFGDETIPLEETWIPSSYTMRYWTQLGVYAEDKLTLRAKANPCNRGAQASFSLQVRGDGEHGHGGPGSVHAYYYKGQQIIHNYGYDSTPEVLNHLFLVRPSELDFLSYSKFKYQLGPQYSKIEAWGWSHWDIPSDWRVGPRGFTAEFNKVAYARVDQHYYTNYDKPYYPDWERYRQQLFNHTREVALDRETGAVFIFDTSISWSALNGTRLWSYGPLWHISEVFQNLTNGVIGQDGDYWTYGSTKSAAFSLTMAGPAGTTYHNVYWKFQGAMSGEWGQVYHPHARYAGPVYAGEPISFITAIVPFDSNVPNMDITAENVGSPPDYSIKVNGGTGTVLIGDRTIQFGKSRLPLQTGQVHYNNFPTKFFVQVQEGPVTYIAALLDNENNTKFETTYVSHAGTQTSSSPSVVTDFPGVIIG